MKIFLTTKIWKEGKHYIAYTPELDLASQGKTLEHAEKRLKEAVDIFVEETKKMGTFDQALQSLGISRRQKRLVMPRISLSGLEVKV